MRWFCKRNKNLSYHYIATKLLCFWGFHRGTMIEEDDNHSTYSYISCDYCHTRKELWCYPKYTLRTNGDCKNFSLRM